MACCSACRCGGCGVQAQVAAAVGRGDLGFLLGWPGLKCADPVNAMHCADAKKHALGMCVDGESRGGWTGGLVVLACQPLEGKRAKALSGAGSLRCNGANEAGVHRKKCVASVNHWLAKTTSGQFR